MLTRVEETKQIQGVRVYRNAPQISHLFYTNDLLLFFKADTESCAKMNEITQFRQMSSVSMNKNKSEIRLVQNTPRTIRKFLADIFGVRIVNKILVNI